MKNNEQMLANLINDEFNLNETENSNNQSNSNIPNINLNTSQNTPSNTSSNTSPNNDINTLYSVLNQTRENIFNTNLFNLK